MPISRKVKRLIDKTNTYRLPPPNKWTGGQVDTSTLNTDQLNAYNTCHRILSPSFEEHIGVLMGNAGTGKSYLTGKITENAVNIFAKRGLKVAIATPTHQAMQVAKTYSPFRDSKHVVFITVPSLLRIREDTDKFTGEQSFKKFGPAKVNEFGAVIFDEASMIPDFQMRYILEVSGKGGEDVAALLFVGDPGQLAPVKASKGTSPAFSKSFWNNNLGRMPEIMSLNQQMRSANGEPVHSRALSCRTPGGYRSLLTSEVSESSWSVTENRHAFLSDTQAIKSLFGAAWHKNPDHARVICYTRNASTSALRMWNQLIRKTIYGEKYPKGIPFIIKDEPIRVSKPLMRQIVSSGSDNEISTEPIFQNGSIIRIQSGKKDTFTTEMLSSISQDYSEGFRCFTALVQEEGTNLLEEIRFLLPSEQRRFNTFLNRLKARATQAWRNNESGRKALWREYKLWRDAAFVSYEHCYALNVHRAQGSSYTISILDYSDLLTQTSGRDRGFYVAASRARKGQIVLTT